MDCSTPGLPVYHQLLEFTQTHVHWVGDAIQPFHPLSSPFSPAFNLSQYQGLFKWVSSSHQVAKLWVSASTSVLPVKTQDWSPLGWTGWISLQSKGLSRVFSNTTVQKHQFFGAQLSLCNNLNTHKKMNYRENFCVSSARTEHKHLTEPAVEITSFHSAQDSQPPSNPLLFQSVYYFKVLLMTFCTLNCKHQPGNYYPWIHSAKSS